MKLNDWLNRELPEISKNLEIINQKYFFHKNSLGFKGKERIHKVIELLIAGIFPELYESPDDDKVCEDISIITRLRETAYELSGVIERALEYNCEKPDCSDCDCREKANEITEGLLLKLPSIREILQTDITAAYEGDPAARFTEEVVLSYPSVQALTVYRIAHYLYSCNVPLVPRIMTEYAHQGTGIDIHPGAVIGEHFFIDHGTGVVIGETVNIGTNVKIYQGVTLGAKSFPLDQDGHPIKKIKRHPNIGDNVIIYSGATILGGDTIIGHDSDIGGNVWLTSSVPPFSRVYNAQPKPIIKSKNGRS